MKKYNKQELHLIESQGKKVWKGLFLFLIIVLIFKIIKPFIQLC
jgi:hypothetical protein